MRNIKKGLVLLMSLVLITVIFAGCKSKPKMEPDLAALGYYNFIVKGDKSDLPKIKGIDSKAEEAIKADKETFSNEIKSAFKAAGLPVNDSQVEDVYKAAMESLKQVSSSLVIVSHDENSADIKIKTTYIDMKALCEKASENAVKEIKSEATVAKDEQQLKNKASEIFINDIIREFKNANPSDTTKEKTFKFIIEDNYWVPKDEKQFGLDISNMVIGQ
ncbi:MAG: DUF5105 domain-containing protein [Bacillota bacterium]|nr:DUF5105 domain-containing protein [Bacillota bacterium]